MRELDAELDRVRRESLLNLDLDRLTGLLNQSALSRRMEGTEPLDGVVAVCDMDDFKEINDRYGHLVGDEILRNIGHLLRASIRPEDEAFRWGGDEFVILFQNQDQAVARARMGEIQRRLRGFRVRGHGMLPISFSWGRPRRRPRAARSAGRGRPQHVRVQTRAEDVRPSFWAHIAANACAVWGRPSACGGLSGRPTLVCMQPPDRHCFHPHTAFPFARPALQRVVPRAA